MKRTLLAAALAAVALPAAASAAPAPAKEETLTCTVGQGGQVRITNSSIYYLLPGAKLYVRYSVAMPGSPNRIKRGVIVVKVKRQLDHDKKLHQAVRLPHEGGAHAECTAYVRKSDKRVTVGD